MLRKSKPRSLKIIAVPFSEAFPHSPTVFYFAETTRQGKLVLSDLFTDRGGFSLSLKPFGRIRRTIPLLLTWVAILGKDVGRYAEEVSPGKLIDLTMQEGGLILWGFPARPQENNNAFGAPPDHAQDQCPIVSPSCNYNYGCREVDGCYGLPSCDDFCGEPTSPPTPSPTYTTTPLPSASPHTSPTDTVASASPSPTYTAAPSASPHATFTYTVTPTVTASPSPTHSASPSPTHTTTPSASPTYTPKPSVPLNPTLHPSPDLSGTQMAQLVLDISISRLTR